MFRNLHLKFFALLLSVIFWIFVVSFENEFVDFPKEIPVQVFNLSSDLALVSEIAPVRLTLRTKDPGVIRSLSQDDFEAYVDLRESGVGKRQLKVSVTSKNPNIAVSRITPSEVDIELESIRKKIVFPELQTTEGSPLEGFEPASITLSKASVTVNGPESLLKKLKAVSAVIKFDGTEKETSTKKVSFRFLDQNDAEFKGLRIFDEVSATVTFKLIEITPAPASIQP